MKKTRLPNIRHIPYFVFAFFLFTRIAATVHGQTVRLDKIRLPEGFRISVYTRKVPNARSLALGARGTIFVGTRVKGGRVYAVRDENGDYKADRVFTIARGLNMPNGVVFRNGALYIAEVERILRFDDIEKRLANPPKPVVVNDGFPSDRAHGWKYIGFGPDGMLYVPVGMPCNVCEKNDPRYGTIMRMKPDGSRLEVFARGVRNSVGFAWHPVTRELWFTDNGRDWMGDDIPPDELNHTPVPGLHFGFPYLHGKNIKDPQYWSRRPSENFMVPAQKLGPHVAALGQ